ncbi:hypothetical protein V6N13_082595 [Hibiscus sabdariffa]
MDADSWGVRLSSASKRYQSAIQSRSNMFMGFEEIDGEDDVREEFPCPFCSEYFDIVGLCCHIDEEHPMEAQNGVCPVCEIRVGLDMVAHITLQHGNIFKMQCKRKSRKGGSHSTLSLLKKELREGNLQSLFGGSCIVSSSNSAPDPLLSSFILPMVDDFVSGQPPFSTETSTTKKSSDVHKSKKTIQSSPLSVKDQEEKAKRSPHGRVQGEEPLRCSQSMVLGRPASSYFIFKYQHAHAHAHKGDQTGSQRGKPLPTVNMLNKAMMNLESLNVREEDKAGKPEPVK